MIFSMRAHNILHDSMFLGSCAHCGDLWHERAEQEEEIAQLVAEDEGFRSWEVYWCVEFSRSSFDS